MRLNKATIKAIAAAVSDSKHTDKAVSDNGADSDVEPSPKKARTNRNNPVLNRHWGMERASCVDGNHIAGRAYLAPITTARISSMSSSTTEFRTELDSHADTSVVCEDTALIIADFERPVTVFGYDEDPSKSRVCKTVSAVVAYDHHDSGVAKMLIIHQAILVPRLKANLLGTMQLRDNGVRVNDEPKYMALNPTNETHALLVPRLHENDDPLLIPLSLYNVASYFPTRKPSREEFDSSDLEDHYELTYESPEWDPRSDDFANQEASMLDRRVMRSHDTLADTPCS
jgi:hypothetical protein